MVFGFSLAQYTQLCRLIVPLSLNVTSSDRTIILNLENLSFRHTCAATTHKIAIAYLGRPHLLRAQVSECKAYF